MTALYLQAGDSHLKCPASAKVVSKSKQNVKQNARILGDFLFGEVSELADEHDLGSCAARRRGSSPLFPSQTRKAANQVGRSLNLDGCIIVRDYCTIDIL